MQLTAKTDYACKALLELALHWPNKEPLQVDAISSRQDIPVRFLTQILLILKQLGYVQSIRGKNGGYLLADHPNTIRLGEVVQRLGNNEIIPNAQNGKCVLSSVWKDLNKMLYTHMNELTFEVIANKQRTQNDAVMFEI